MQVAFLVKLDLPSRDGTDRIANDVQDLVESEGYNVIDVTVWSANTTQLLSPPEVELKPNTQPINGPNRPTL